ncbi:MAG: hypothetical protein WCW13_02400 [archaeon]|jgi:hypothetical protein
MKKFFYKSKGFIGPIGDDLPSLIPIVVSLVLFFTIFALTLNTFNSKNLYIEKQMNLTSVAREIKGDSLILSIEDFQKKCDAISLKKFPYNFMVGVYFSESDLKKSIDDFVLVSKEADPTIVEGTKFIPATTIAGDSRTYSCKYSRVGAIAFNPKKSGSYMLRYYPVAVQYPIGSVDDKQYIILPAVMAMVVWE